MDDLVLVGRSSSHFTRTARIFALELHVTHVFRPVFDIMSLDPATYAGNPALKVPVLVDERGPLYGTENICRELVRRSGRAASVVMRGAHGERLVANLEELTLHAMSTGVALITATLAGESRPAPTKVMRSLESTLSYLDRHVDGLLASLPPTRTLSFVEVTLFCLVTHLPFRKIFDVTPFTRLVEFAAHFARRESVRVTEYRFDQP